MNKLIKEFALQSGVEMCSCGCDMPTRQSAAFAKLIIQECVDVASDNDYNCYGDMGTAIREHFGVA